MSILILRGPHATHPDTSPLDPSLRSRAHAAWQALHCRAFATLRGLLAGLRRARTGHTDLLLLDVGDLTLQNASHAQAVRDALDALPTPYIELHDDAAHALEPRIHPQHAPLVTVILRDDLPRAYSMALDIALRRLRPAASEPFHA